MRSTEMYKNKHIFALYFRFTCLMNRKHKKHFALDYLFLLSLFSFLTFSIPTASGSPSRSLCSDSRTTYCQLIAMVQRESTALLCKRQTENKRRIENTKLRLLSRREPREMLVRLCSHAIYIIRSKNLACFCDCVFATLSVRVSRSFNKFAVIAVFLFISF